MEVKIGTREQKNTSTTGLKKEVESKGLGKGTTTRVIPFPIDEKSDTIDWSSPGKPFSNQRTEKNRTLVQIFISIAGALLVGTIMGISILSLFFSDPTTRSSHSIDAHLPAPTVKTTTKTSEMKPLGTKLPTLQVAFLQAGNYQSKSSASRVADQYRTQGFAAVMSERVPYRIYLGVASNKADAHHLAKRYLNKGIRVYVKELSIGGSGKDVASIVTALKIGNKLFAELQQLSVTAIVHKGKVKVPTSLAQKQLAFMKASQISTNYPTDVRAAMIELARGLDQAVQGATELSKHPNATLAWFVQEGLVRYASGYEQLIYALSQNQR